MITYHVTEKKYLNEIMSSGLVPRIGPRSEDLGEETPAIYLFANMDSVENALMNWLGEWFEENDEDAELVLLEINLSGLNIDLPDENSFEIIVYDQISSDRITYIKEC